MATSRTVAITAATIGTGSSIPMCLSRSTVRMLNLCIIPLMVVITTVVMKSTGIPATEVVTGRKRHKGRGHLGLVTM
jgi:hypothetical protein